MARRGRSFPGLVRQTLDGWEWECRHPRCGGAECYFGAEFYTARRLVVHERRHHGTTPSTILIPPPPPPWIPVTETALLTPHLEQVWGEEQLLLDKEQRRLVLDDVLFMVNEERWAEEGMAVREHQRRILPGNLARYAAVLQAQPPASCGPADRGR